MSFKACKPRLTFPIHSFTANGFPFCRDILQAALLLGSALHKSLVRAAKTWSDIYCMPLVLYGKDQACFSACFNDYLHFPKIKNLCPFTGMLNFTEARQWICCEPRTKALEHTEEATQLLPSTSSNLFQTHKQLRHHCLKFWLIFHALYAATPR